MPRLASSTLALATRSTRTAACAPALARASSTGPQTTHMGDPRTDMFKRVLYPPDSVSPTSASPIGERHPQHLARIQHVLPSAEAYETTERAWALFRRRKREARELALNAKFNAMKDACDELEAVASLQKNMSLYDNAMVRVAHGAAAYRAAAQGLKQGNKKTPESRFIEARPEGMVPREQWVPTETRGKGWKYEWERPLNEW